MAGFEVWVRRLLSAKKDADPSSSLPRARMQPGGPESFAEGNNDFALAIYGRLRERPGNILFSPFSIRSSLGMAQAGARGETAAQMAEALRTSLADDRLHVGLAAILQRLNAAGGGQYEIALANSLWGQDGAPLRAEFLDLIARHYDGGLNLVDFRRDPERARATINQWVDDKTKRKILELIPSGGLDADTRLVLVNAVYFRGRWVLQFDRDATRDERFDVEGGGTVQVPLMHQREEVRHVQLGGYQAVDLVYKGHDLSMLVLLPDHKDGLRDLEKGLSTWMLHDCVTQMASREVELFLPRFKITWGTVDMCSYLTTLGMTLPFNPSQADFSGINGCQPPESLFISAVFHKAFAEVNEEGTEAAAATAVHMRWLGVKPSKPPPAFVFKADHPFLFAIRDRKSGVFLFLGRMADPTQDSR